MTITHTTAEWQALDAAHYLHPFTDHKSLAARGTRVITHAEGVYLYDSEGNRVLDGMSGLWCVALGYGHRELAEAAYRKMQELQYYNSFSDFSGQLLEGHHGASVAESSAILPTRKQRA